jgi:hypothetical protein
MSGLAETAVARSKEVAMVEKYILKNVGAMRGLKWWKERIEVCDDTAKWVGFTALLYLILGALFSDVPLKDWYWSSKYAYEVLRQRIRRSATYSDSIDA